MTIKAWSGFTKRKNSTKVPTATGTDITVTLKDDCSADAPVFILNSAAYTSGINYIQFRTAYYYVDDVISLHNNLVEIHCSKDVLATYKSDITGSTQHVLYYTHSNTQISDSRLSTKTDAVIDSDTETFQHLGTGQAYMLTVVGKDNTSVLACYQSYVDGLFTDNILGQMDTTFSNAINDVKTTAGGASTATTAACLIDLLQCWFDWKEELSDAANSAMYAGQASDFVKNCYVLPVAPDHIAGSMGQMQDPIYLGKWKSDAKGYINFPRILHDSATVDIPWQASDWRRNAPYHHIYLYIPYIGVIDISPSEVMGANTLTVNVSIDTYSGVSTFVVNASNGVVVGQYSTNIASQYAIGSANVNVLAAGAQIISSAASIVAGAATGNPLGATAGALGLANAIKPIDQSVASNSGAAGMGLGNTVKCFTVFHDTTVGPNNLSAVKGTPYNASMSLSGVSGYVQTSGASVPIAGFGKDKDLVNNYLNGGIYIE